MSFFFLMILLQVIDLGICVGDSAAKTKGPAPSSSPLGAAMIPRPESKLGIFSMPEGIWRSQVSRLDFKATERGNAGFLFHDSAQTSHDDGLEGIQFHKEMAYFFTRISRIYIRKNFQILQKLSPSLGGAFKIPSKCIKNGIQGIPRGHLRPFRWLKLEITGKETWHFKFYGTSLSHHISKNPNIINYCQEFW